MSISVETLQSLSAHDIQKLTDDLKKIEYLKEKEIVKRFISEMEAIGISYDSIKDKKVSELLKNTKAKQEPQFMNPNDKSQTWSGQGATPLWLKELIGFGRDKEEFRIKK
jgi:DNA-binding protein H-NS